MSDAGRDDGHVDLDTLAELAEDLGGPGEAEDPDGEPADGARAHLARCPRCRQQAADIAEVQRVLAAAPPATMPDHVVARIDASLEAAADAPGFGGTPSRRVDRSPVPRRWYRRRPLQAGLAAAATVVLAVGGMVTGNAIITDRGTVESAGSGVPDSREMAPEADGPPAAQPMQGSGNAGPPILATDSDYSADTLDDQVAALVQRRMAGSDREESARSAARTPRALRPLAEQARLSGCVDAATGDADRRPTVVDLARYDGEPAAILVFADRGRFDVWVVGESCSADDPEVLLHTRVQP